MGDNTTSISQDRSSLVGLRIQGMDPFSSSSSSYYHALEMGNGDDSGAGSEEGLDVPEDPAKVVPHRSTSKRSRAAEVHNLSEKRRRSRINEKMKALQNLIPNSNKTDKASMLDEAIEYLKQLQLQVQMLLMRNGLTSHPMYSPSPSSLHPLQACMNFGDNAAAMNLVELGFLNLNQDSAMNSSYDLTNQCTNSHRSVMLPTASISAPESPFVLEPSQPHHATFLSRVPGQEAFTEERASHQQLDSARTTANLPDVMKTMEAPSSSCYGAQASSSSRAHNDRLPSVLSKDYPDGNPMFVQHFDGLQGSSSFTRDNVSIVKSEAQGM